MASLTRSVARNGIAAASPSLPRVPARLGGAARRLPVGAAPSRAVATRHSVRVCAAAEVSTEKRPARVIPTTLPRVYVYDHCPFCVRVRLAMGYKVRPLGHCEVVG